MFFNIFRGDFIHILPDFQHLSEKRSAPAKADAPEIFIITLLSDGELIHLRKQAVGNTISVLTEVDEYLAEEVVVVAAYGVIGNVAHRAVVFQNKQIRELLSFFIRKRSDERIERLRGVVAVRCGRFSKLYFLPLRKQR